MSIYYLRTIFACLVTQTGSTVGWCQKKTPRMKAFSVGFPKMLKIALLAVVANASLFLSLQAQDAGPLRFGTYQKESGEKFEGVMVGVTPNAICVFGLPDYEQYQIPRASLPKQQQLWAVELERQVEHLISPITGVGKIEGRHYSKSVSPAKQTEPKLTRISELVRSRNGRVQHFAENGRLFDSMDHEEGVPHGLTVQFYPNGATFSILYCAKGSQIIKTTFHEDGIAKSCELFRHGKQVRELGYHANGLKLGFAEIGKDNIPVYISLSTKDNVHAASMEMVNGQLNLELKIKDEKLALSLAEQFVSNKRALMDAWTKALSKN